MGLLLGIDAGTTALKVGVFSDAGAPLAMASEEYALETPGPDRAELEALRYWSSLVAATRRAIAAAGLDGRDVSAIGVSSQGETIVPVATDGSPLAPALVWLDNRAAEEAAELAAAFDPALVYRVTGIPAVNPTWPAAKLLWWKRHAPAVFEGAARFLLIEDFLLHRLTGRFVTEGGVQCTSMLYDIRGHGWWRPMLEHLELEADRLPALARTGEVVGTLTPSAARELGLAPSVQVVAAGMDQGSGAVGVGNVLPGIVSESTGGALTVQSTTDRPDGDATGRTPVYVHSAPERYLFCPVCPTGGLVLTWFRDRFGLGPGGPEFRAEDVESYEELTRLAAEAPPGSDGLTTLPHLMGAFSPEYEPRARGVFYGFTLAHGRPHFVRAILESVAFMLRRNVELLAAAGATSLEIRSHGGGARSDLWCQIKADVCALPVARLAGEGAAVRGDAMLAGVAVSAFRDVEEACSAMVNMEERFAPDRVSSAIYEGSYRRYVALYEALRPIYGT